MATKRMSVISRPVDGLISTGQCLSKPLVTFNTDAGPR